MALPAFRSASAKAAGTTGALAVNLPVSMVAGDVVILVATTIAGGSITISTAGSISTWTEITSGGLDVASGEKLYVWWGRWASGATGPSVTPGSDHCCAGTVAYSGCVPTGSPIGTSATSTEVTSDTSFSFATGISSGENDCLVICVASNGNDSNTATVGNMANTSLASLNNRQDFCTTSGGGGGYSLQDGTKATAGTMGTFTSTYSAVTPKAYIAFNLRPVVAISITTGIGTVVITGVAPTVSVTNNTSITTSTGVVTIVGVVPTVTATDNKNISTGLGTVTIVGLVPTISVSDNKNISTGVGTISIVGLVPTANIGVNITTALGIITIVGLAPTVSVSDHKNISIGLGVVAVSGLAPTVSVSNNINISTGVGSINISGLAPTIQTPINVQTDLGGIIINGLAPTISVSNNISVTPVTGEIVIQGYSPSLGNSINISTGKGEIVITGLAPTVDISSFVNAITQTGEIIIQGYEPFIAIGMDAIIETQTGLIYITGFAPSFHVDRSGGVAGRVRVKGWKQRWKSRQR